MLIVNVLLSFLVLLIYFTLVTLSIPIIGNLLKEHLDAQAFTKAEVILGIWIAVCIFLLIFFNIFIAWLWKTLVV